MLKAASVVICFALISIPQVYSQVTSCGGCNFYVSSNGTLWRGGLSCNPSACDGDLFFMGQGITSLQEDVFHGLSSLRRLYLHTNQITVLSEGTFQGMSSLYQLELQHNQLMALPEGLFRGLSSMLYLHLDHNKFSMLPAGIFNGLTKLKEIFLGYNLLQCLPVYMPTGAQVSWYDRTYLSLPACPDTTTSAYEASEARTTTAASTAAYEGDVTTTPLPQTLDTNSNTTATPLPQTLDTNSNTTAAYDSSNESSFEGDVITTPLPQTLDTNSSNFSYLEKFSYPECLEVRTWEEIMIAYKDQQHMMSAGGLGKLATPDFKVWACFMHHPCLTKLDPDSSTDKMCYMYHENQKEWHPLGLKSELNLWQSCADW
jgi:hypothetical protein